MSERHTPAHSPPHSPALSPIKNKDSQTDDCVDTAIERMIKLNLEVADNKDLKTDDLANSTTDKTFQLNNNFNDNESKFTLEENTGKPKITLDEKIDDAKMDLSEESGTPKITLDQEIDNSKLGFSSGSGMNLLPGEETSKVKRSFEETDNKYKTALGKECDESKSTTGEEREDFSMNAGKDCNKFSSFGPENVKPKSPIEEADIQFNMISEDKSSFNREGCEKPNSPLDAANKKSQQSFELNHNDSRMDLGLESDEPKAPFQVFGGNIKLGHGEDADESGIPLERTDNKFDVINREDLKASNMDLEVNVNMSQAVLQEAGSMSDHSSSGSGETVKVEAHDGSNDHEPNLTLSPVADNKRGLNLEDHNKKSKTPFSSGDDNKISGNSSSSLEELSHPTPDWHGNILCPPQIVNGEIRLASGEFVSISKTILDFYCELSAIHYKNRMNPNPPRTFSNPNICEYCGLEHCQKWEEKMKIKTEDEVGELSCTI